MPRLLLELGGVLALCFAIGGWYVEHNRHEQSIGVAECQAKVDAAIEEQTKLQVEQETKYEQQLDEVNAEHQAELAAIPTRVVSTPVRLCNASPVRSGPVPQVPAAPQAGAAGAGGSVGGSRGDNIRPEIEQFKAKLETIVADCRAAIAQWPP